MTTDKTFIGSATTESLEQVLEPLIGVASGREIDKVRDTWRNAQERPANTPGHFALWFGTTVGAMGFEANISHAAEGSLRISEVCGSAWAEFREHLMSTGLPAEPDENTMLRELLCVVISAGINANRSSTFARMVTQGVERGESVEDPTMYVGAAIAYRLHTLNRKEPLAGAGWVIMAHVVPPLNRDRTDSLVFYSMRRRSAM